jgi:hypothetical protein
LFWHCVRRAASRAACTAGNNNAIKMPMMAITTSNSTNVNPRTDDQRVRTAHLRQQKSMDFSKDATQASIHKAQMDIYSSLLNARIRRRSA